MTPSCSSSCLIAADSVGWVMPQFLGRAAEMLLLGERDEEFELVDHGEALGHIGQAPDDADGIYVNAVESANLHDEGQAAALRLTAAPGR